MTILLRRNKKYLLERYGYNSPFMNKDIANKRIISYRDRSVTFTSISYDYEYIDHFIQKMKLVLL
jgi:hypothetical protein